MSLKSTFNIIELKKQIKLQLIDTKEFDNLNGCKLTKYTFAVSKTMIKYLHLINYYIFVVFNTYISIHIFTL